MTSNRDFTPPTAAETERSNRQPGAKGHPHEKGASRESPDVQPEESLRPEHRRKPSGLLDRQHRPGPRNRPERKP
jgi:hypothetical protein